MSSLKLQGQLQAEAAAPSWTSCARRWILDLTPGTHFTADDLIETVGLPHESESNRNNAVGAVFSGLARAQHIERTHHRVTSTRRARHGGEVAVWRRLPNG